MVKNLLYSSSLFLAIFFLVVAIQGSDANKNADKELVFHFAYSNLVFQDIDARDANAALLVYVRQIEKNFYERRGFKVVLRAKIYYSIDEIKAGLLKNEFDLISVPSDQFFELKKFVDLEPCLKVVSSEETFSQYAFIASQIGGISSFVDVKNKSFAMPTNYKNWLVEKWIEVLLHRNKLRNIGNTFKSVNLFSTESKVVYDIFFSKIDCGVVRMSTLNTLFELNPQLKKSIKILSASPQFIPSILSYRKDNKANLLDLVIEEAKELHKTENGKSILKIFKAIRVDKSNISELQSVKLLLDEYNSIIKLKK